MSNKKLCQLAIVAAIMVVWAVIQSQLANRPSAKPGGPAYLIQGMDPAEIASMTLGHGDETVTISKNDNGRFVVANKANYPADAEQINDLLTKCFDLKTKELVTKKAKNFEALEVTEDTAQSVVKFFKADGSLLTGILVGTSPESGGAYVRRADSDEVYLADSAPWIRSGAIDYIKQELVEVEADDVKKVTVTTPEGSYTLTPGQNSSDVAMVDLPVGKKLKSSDARSVLTALTSLRFDDVNTPPSGDPNATAAIEGLSFDYRYVCRLANETEYTFELAKTEDDKIYARCSAAYFGDKVTIDPSKVDSEEERKEKEARLLAEEHYQRFNLRHKGWIYKLPEWKAKNLTMKQADLLDDIEVEAPAEPEPVAVEPNVPAEPEPEAAETAMSPVLTPEPTPVIEPNQPVTEPNGVTVDPNQVTPDPNEPPADPNDDPVVE